MFEDGEGRRRPLNWIIERFQQEGATSPEKAMTVQELGLPPRFEKAVRFEKVMHWGFGPSDIFVEVNGKYYLDEGRLKQIQEERARAGFGSAGGGGSNSERPASWFGHFAILLVLPISLIIVAVMLFYFISFSGEFFSGEIPVVLLIVFVGLFVARLLFRRASRKYWRDRWMP
jgi:hypothetical protein